MYKISKVINNNVLIVLDSKLREYVIFGKGIGFKQIPGNTITDSNVERKYLATGVESEYTIKLLEETDFEVMIVCEEIKQLVEKSYDLEYTNHAYFSLIDHVNNTIYRQKINLNIGTAITVKELELYKKELDLATDICKLLETKLNINISEEEIVYLTMHLISFIYDSQLIQLNEKVIIITNEIIEIIRYDLMNEIKDNFNLHRFIVHLKFFILRNLQKTNSVKMSTNTNLYNQLISQNKKAENTLEKICAFLKEKYLFEINDDEKLYLLIHLSKLTSI